jgi:iron complex outermembrane receptor protein
MPNYMEEIGLHFHPHPLDWLHYETSFETVTGKKQDGDYLPLIPANNYTSERSFQSRIGWIKVLQR